ncbi:MAG: PepSY-associated TM helix domain-containing protein [Bacteroidota bacterium]
MFSLHTMSSIIISVAVFVIFFAGTFSFFRDEIVNWERGHQVSQKEEIDANIDTLLAALGETHNLYGRDVSLTLYYNERRVGVSMTGSKDSTALEDDKVGAFFYLDTHDHTTATYTDSYSLGEFLYRLHFFAQIPYPYGYHLSGFMAFFLLFAILTGLIVHWDKIVTNFFVFRPKAKWKTIWTDSHTALGLIGFPFQLVYALTGAYFMLQAFQAAPFLLALYNQDQAAMDKDLGVEHPVFEFSYERMETPPVVMPFISRTLDTWNSFRIQDVHVYNFGDQNMHLEIGGTLPYEDKLNGEGKAIYKVSDGSLVHKRDPHSTSRYIEVVGNLLYRLHLADYAHVGLRIISFLLGLLSCYVVLSGVMIWLVARDKKMTSDKQRRYNRRVVWAYLAICLSMYPVTALAFSLVKLFPGGGMTFLYRTYFISWLVLSLFFIWKRNNAFILKWSLLLGGILGFLVPVVNGLSSGQWIWVSWVDGYEQVLLIDVMWLALSTSSFWAVAKLTKKVQVGKKPVLARFT